MLQTRKILAMLLAAVMLCTMPMPALAARHETTSAVADNAAQQAIREAVSCDDPVVFVTGIGQTWLHVLNPDGSWRVKRKLHWDGTIEEKPIRYNFLQVEWRQLAKPAVLAAALRTIGRLLPSAMLRRNLLRQQDLETVFAALFRLHILDDEGNLPPDAESADKPYPVSEYDSEEQMNLYRSIPCRFIVEQIGAENVYCFYHAAFSYLYRDADALHTFIRDVVLPRHDHAEKVVLIPMSMGAAVVSAYLDRYGEANEVQRVVSIVGAWDGSDVLADLIEQRYTHDAPELLYHGLPQMGDEDDEALLLLATVLIRIFPKQVLRDIIDTMLSAFVRTLVLRTPSLMALVPAARYPAIRDAYLADDAFRAVRDQTDLYYEAQRTVRERIGVLQQNGMEFYFLCGYGLTFGGAEDSDYRFMAFLESAASVNSDEIIPISSTSLGGVGAPAGQTLGYTGAYVSPDGTLDLSAAFAPDKTWCFYRQKHELDYNNTALRLAFAIAMGDVKDVAGSALQYPQFNLSRDVGTITSEVRGRVPYTTRMEQYIAAHEDDPSPEMRRNVERVRVQLARVNAMLENTHNDPQTDDAIVAETKALLIELGMESAPEATPAYKTQFTAFCRRLSERVYARFGAAGFCDRFCILPKEVAFSGIIFYN